MKKYLRINSLDNVVVTLENIPSGTVWEELGITALQDIHAGHKCARRDIEAGEPVIKYGNPIGKATESIKKGEWVHTHNVKTGLSGKLEYRYEPVEHGISTIEQCSNDLQKTFMGYKRKNGEGGIRNEIWIIPTVGCVNHIAEELTKKFSKDISGEFAKDCSKDIPGGFTGKLSQDISVVAMTHPYGCSQMGDDQENTAQILADIAKHPNCGGALILSLGCENNNLDHMRPYLEGIDEDRVRYLICQDVEDEIAEGSRLIGELIGIVSRDEREPVPVSKLTVGLKCGGSDGFSGITANPLVGRFSDIITALGGSGILTEVPEMFGAEQLLMNRAQNREVFDKTVDLINGFKEYYERHNQVIYENPSPGNKKGGITTLEDKSLGCVQKSGSSQVMDVLRYGERVKVCGLNLLEGPGNDMVAVTALAAAGAQIILFTTGRGTPLSSPVPTVKISSNSALAAKKRGWIDFDAGKAVSEDIGLEELGDELYRYIIEVASGRQVKSELAGYHSMTIFKQGVTL